MKSYLSMAWKELKTQRVTTALILLAVILSTIATAAMGQSVGILQSMRTKQALGLNGDRYATFHQLTDEQEEALHTDARLKEVGSHITVGTMKLANSSLTLFLREYYGDALGNYPDVGKVKEGRLPASAGEIALSVDALQYLGIEAKTGEKISLPLEIGLLIDDRPHHAYVGDFTLTGILENNYLGYTTGIVEGITGEGTAQALLPERYLRYSTDFKTVKKKDFQAVVDDLVKKLEIDEKQVQYNWVALDALGVDYGDKGSVSTSEGFPFMIAACVMTGALILLAAGLVIYNILKVAVSKRIREYGTLRAIGSTGGQLYKLVTVQIMILCAVGVPVGLVLGALSAKSILLAAVGLLNPEMFLADTTEELNQAIVISETGGAAPLCVSVLVTLAFAMIAAYPTARYAVRVSPTAAMGGQAASIRRRSRRQRKIRNFEAFYARLNLRRNRGRTAITILSIVMSITVYVALQDFSRLLDASEDVQNMHMGDYSVTNETVGIGPEAAEQIRTNEFVAGMAASKLTVYSSDTDGNMSVEIDLTLHPGETFQIAAVDRERMENFIQEAKLTPEDLEEIERGEACFVKNPIPISIAGEEIEWTNLKKDDFITVNGKKIRVAGIREMPVAVNNGGFINGVQIIVADAVYDVLTGLNGYNEVYPVLKDEMDYEAFEKWLEGWCNENPGTHWLSYRQSDAQLAESFKQIRLLCWGLILFIGLIGILNIINTVYTNIHTRVNEIGMQRAVGMSVGSLYRTFLWEGAYYGMIASAIGSISGYACTLLVEAAANDGMGFVPFPLGSVLTAAAVSVAACMAATAIPLRAVEKMSIVEAVTAVE